MLRTAPACHAEAFRGATARQRSAEQRNLQDFIYTFCENIYTSEGCRRQRAKLSVEKWATPTRIHTYTPAHLTDWERELRGKRTHTPSESFEARQAA